jgi:energy-coupling factor transporter transmembrane protein EcfT
MQDPRIRIAAGAVLSLAAFASVPGAVAVFAWWLVFTPALRMVNRIRTAFPMILLIAFFSVVIELCDGNGVSYFVRMIAIILIGIWIYTEQQSGEFLDTGVWLLGSRTGFEIGMLAEMTMQSITSLASDFERIRMAEKLKGLKWEIHNLVPAGLVIVHGALTRAQDTAELLAVRGYRNGGTVCPQFKGGPWDRVAGIAALCVLVISLVPLREFFILYC